MSNDDAIVGLLTVVLLMLPLVLFTYDYVPFEPIVVIYLSIIAYSVAAKD